jgi:signal transduction histidine kinase
VWFVVAESLTNTVTHARATSVRVARDEDALRVTVTDNGCGGAHEVAGGLAGLRDRVEAAGGSLQLGIRPHGGSEVRAVVPLRAAPAGTAPMTAVAGRR